MIQSGVTELQRIIELRRMKQVYRELACMGQNGGGK